MGNEKTATTILLFTVLQKGALFVGAGQIVERSMPTNV